MFKIEKGVPVTARHPKKRYPISQMEAGDSFVVLTNSERIYAAQMARKCGFVYTSRKQKDGTYRIWRVE